MLVPVARLSLDLCEVVNIYIYICDPSWKVKCTNLAVKYKMQNDISSLSPLTPFHSIPHLPLLCLSLLYRNTLLMYLQREIHRLADPLNWELVDIDNAAKNSRIMGEID